MKTRQKVIVDRIVAGPIAWHANLAARALGTVLHRDRSIDPGHVRTIVVSKLIGMGSIIQATPLLRALRHAYPTARIVFVTTKANRVLVERLRFIDEGVYLDDGNLLKLGRQASEAMLRLAARGVDLHFDLEVYSAASSLLSLMSMARLRFGFYRHSAQFKKGIHTHLVFFNTWMPVSELYLQLFRVIAGNVETPAGFGPISVTDEDRRGFAATYPELAPGGGQTEYVVVNANASDLMLERRWPLGHFVSLIGSLHASGLRVVLIGAPSEASYVKELESALPLEVRESVTNTAGRLKLGELFALIENASCVVTNDTGPMHISIALDRPTVCMFGPGSPEHYGVYRPNTEVFYEGVVCSPCIYETDEPPCAGRNVCMQQIRPDAVAAAVHRLLGRQAPESKAPIRRLTLVDDRGRALGTVARASLTE